MDAICEDATCATEDLEARLAAAMDEIDGLATDYARVMDEKDALLAEVRELAAHNARLGEDLAVAKSTLVPLQLKLDKATERAKGDAKTIEARAKECERMIEDRAKLREQVFRLHQQLQSAVAERTQLEWRLDRSGKRLSSISSLLEEAKAELRAARSDCGETLDALTEALAVRLERQTERLQAISKERDWFAAQVRSSRLSEDQQVQALARLELWNDAMRARLLAMDARADGRKAPTAKRELTEASDELDGHVQSLRTVGEQEFERMREQEELALMRAEERDWR